MSVPYVSYDYYSNTYGGGLTEEAFAVQEPAAEAYIRYLTKPNGDVFAVSDDDVKRAVCAVAEAREQVFPAAGGEVQPEVKSASNDGYSESYVTSRKDGETGAGYADRLMYDAARRYLLWSGWLYRGANRGSCCGEDAL